MKDTRFTELVNLYIDRQISATEAAELEAELKADVRRRQTYQEYCRIHRATKLVFESFRENAGSPADSTPVQVGALARFENQQRQRRGRWIAAVGGLAAAACVALVLSNLPATGGDPDTTIVQAATPAATAVEATAPRAIVPAAPVNLVSLRNPLVLEADYQAALVAVRRDEQQRLMAAAPILNAPRPAVSLFDDNVFESRQVMPERNSRTFRGVRGSPNQPPVELTAFQFQR